MLTRRNFLAVSAGAAAAALAGCAGEKDEPPAAAPAAEPAEDVPAADAAPADTVLVAYFSATGNTEGVAAAIAERLGVDVFAIETAEPYTEADLNYSDDTSRTSVERADARPELAQVTPDDWTDYGTVLLGYPIWWGEAAWPLRTFAEGNDFAGKTVVPFCTSGSSGIGSSAELLAGLAGSGDWREGERFSAGAGDEAAEWAAGLGL
ncbi:flavodoxin [Olsenella sp. An290]|uniref:flavodoxin n=1 Tax=Olsenella sp. An290 TaxID=1965625 RepID=UPI000B36578B|nr:flavodoxin [Olsenella sp. An290]OUO33466.1 hypothetical protein B5F84_08730 [Olsenella sp. An290]